jgi:hypothetical protein
MEVARGSQWLFYPRESRGTLGSRALSHDSIFIPESGQDPARPVRVFSQENVCDRIKALQVSTSLAVSLAVYVRYQSRRLQMISPWLSDIFKVDSHILHGLPKTLKLLTPGS